ncbi:MAG: hypothetical protein ACYT04_81605, partial [Nostoc sp.]
IKMDSTDEVRVMGIQETAIALWNFHSTIVPVYCHKTAMPAAVNYAPQVCNFDSKNFTGAIAP